MPLNCSVGEDSWESLGWQRDQTSQSKMKSVLNIHWRDCCWGWSANTLATWCEEPTHWKRPWCWGRVKAGEGDNRGWDGRMASLMPWTWVCVGFRSWWWKEKPGMLQSMRSQRVGHDWVTELKQYYQPRKFSEIHQGTRLNCKVGKTLPHLFSHPCSSPTPWTLPAFILPFWDL